MNADFVFVGWNLNTYVQEKTPEHARFMDDALKTRSIKNI